MAAKGQIPSFDPGGNEDPNLPTTERTFNKTLVFYVRPKFARATKLSEPATR
jgi:hypothetical protein